MIEQKPLPCAFCGHEPENTWDYITASIFCPNKSCVISEEGLDIFTWNIFHAAIMAQRRKDFEAGQESMDVEWDDGVEIYADQTFDQYLEEQKK
mgnify:CR=1 FL=1